MGNKDNEETKKPMEKAKKLLCDVLKDGEQSSKDIHLMAKENGISESTLKRAKKELNIDSLAQKAEDLAQKKKLFGGLPSKNHKPTKIQDNRPLRKLKWLAIITPFALT